MIKIKQKAKNYQNLFLDMDGFFASVEKQVRPKLRSKPVGVAPYTGGTGCIVAKCYQAKAKGVKTGMKVSQAKKLCPKIEVIEARPQLYIIYHQQIEDVLNDLTPFYRSLSIDEFVIDLGKKEQNKRQSLILADKIKKEIKDKVGDFLTCSIGIGPNLLLSKMASEFDKPNGKVVLKLKEIDSFLAKLKLTDIPGINTKTKKHLFKIGIKNPLNFKQANQSKLTRHLGVKGKSWYLKLRGQQLTRGSVKNKTIGHSHVLPPQYRSKRKATQVIKKLAHKVGRRMRKDGYWAKGIKLSITFEDGFKFKKSRSTAPFSSNSVLVENINSILKKCSWRLKPLKVKVRVYNLTKSYINQQRLFADMERSKKISLLVDEINDRFEDSQMITFAGSLEAKKTAPDRISFGNSFK